ncbi:DUF397 domain-containing protein [Streptomyces sp. NPDC003247]|uniref:DUF397 domain-containing protein n=1 Tax=Streptomyces sp. NPDC003247 TaxID=3364677 RepID=UPI0036B9FD98
MPDQWQKSSFSGAGGENCIEVASDEPLLLLRESEEPDDALELAPAGLQGLICHLKAKA